MSHYQRQVNLEDALKKLKTEGINEESVRAVVYASSRVFTQGMSLSHEQVDNIIKRSLEDHPDEDKTKS